jgi:hypothetical protein
MPTLLGILSLLPSGCAALESRIAVLGTTKEVKVFDLSSHTNPTAKLILRCRPPSRQFGVDHYEFFIDEAGPYAVSKYSDSEITLDPGDHSLRVVAVTSDHYRSLMPAREFGSAAVKEFDITANTMLVFEYMGPYWDWGRGKLSRKKE